MGVPKSWKMVEIQQQCRFGFTPQFVDDLCKNWSVVKDYAWIMHDKDHDDADKVHIHCFLRFNDSVPTSALLAKIKGVGEVQHLEHIKGGWKNAMAYCVHWNAPEKHQYDPSEVHSNFDWQTDAKDALKGKARLEQIVSQIDSGEIKRYNLHKYVTSSEYVTYERKIESAFRYVDRRNMERTDRKMDVIYIYGEPGTGKTTYAKQMCSDKGYTFFVSASGKDFLDGYQGQDAIIIDDVRGSTMPVATILKLLDNHTASAVASRYQNKSISECKLIVLTSVLPPDALFEELFTEHNEPAIQLKRRISLCMAFYRDKIIMKRYDAMLQDFEVITSVPNLVLINIQQSKPEDKKRYLAELLGGTSMLVEYMKDHLDEVDFDKPIEGQIEVGQQLEVGQGGTSAGK